VITTAHSPKHPLPPGCLPRGLSEEQAAYDIGVKSTETFRKMICDGEMPQPRKARGRNSWDVRDLDAYYDRLPYREEANGLISISTTTVTHDNMWD
jgi:hypothetical protein